MARPPKKGLNYSTWDVGVLENDTNIDKLVDAQGTAGFYVYFGLCQRAYATDGYFYRWDYGDAATTARKLGGGLSSDQVRAIVDACLSLGLFDRALFSGHGILTSRAIQARYLEGIARRTGIQIYTDYWLLETKTAAGVVFVRKNGVIDSTNAGFGVQESSFSTLNEITRNEKKETPNISSPQESNVENSAREQRRESCTKLLALVQSHTGVNYQGNKETRRAVYALIDRGYTERDVRAVIQMAAWQAQQAREPWPAMDELFGRRFDGYIQMPPASTVEHPDWVRDHYLPLPAKAKRRKR